MILKAVAYAVLITAGLTATPVRPIGPAQPSHPHYYCAVHCTTVRPIGPAVHGAPFHP